MKNTTQPRTPGLIRSVPYWLLLVLSLAVAAIGGRLVWDNIETMQRTLLDGSATNVEVYVGQAWITAGAAILAAGVIGFLLALAIAAAKALIPVAPVVVEQIDWDSEADRLADPSTGSGIDERDSEIDERDAETAEQNSETEEQNGSDQNGSNGSIATATNSNVK